MQNKEQILELQAIFSRRHIGILVAMLLFMTNNIIINNNNDGMKYISCAVICLVLMLDVFFAYFSFFHKYVLVVILRFAEMAIIGMMISDVGGTGIGGMSDLFVIMFYAMFMIETVYMTDLSDPGNRVKFALLGQIPYVIRILYIIISGESNYTAHIVNTVIMGAVSFMIMFSVTRYCGKMQEYYDQCILSRDRMLDRAKDNTDKINESQNTIREANEQLGIKKFELEEAYKRINVVNSNNSLQNKFLRMLLMSSLDLNQLISKAHAMFENDFHIDFSGLIFKDKKIRRKYDSGIDKFFDDEEDYIQFCDFFLSSAFIYEHSGIDGHFIDNDISYDEFPFFKKKGISAIAIKSIVAEDSRYNCIYVLFSANYNMFIDKVDFLENIFGQIDIVAKNLTLYHKVEEMSIKDALTGLYNRRYLNLYFNDHFVKEKNIDHNVTLAMLDIDHFKNINDTYGHLFGDQAIEHVSGLIRDCTEKHNGTGFRYGGEEMVVIFENKTLEETVAIMDSLRNDIKNTYIKNGDEAVCVKVSVGVSAYPETTQQINTLIDRADKAMYYSKQNGRDRLTVDGTFEGEE